MSKQVTIVDYGSGNLLSVSRALAQCGADVIISRDPSAIERATRLVLPGVGAFGDGMEGLRRRDLVEPVRAFAMSGRPLLGICLGMQMLMTSSEEFGHHAGLNLIPGCVLSLPDRSTGGQPLKRPHIGWVDLHQPADVEWTDSLLESTAPGTSVYLVHSYAAHPSNPEDCLAECNFGGHRIVACVRRRNVVGCQFHPEKSGPAGLRILSRFVAADLDRS